MQSFECQPVKQAPFESIDNSNDLSPAKKLIKKKTIIIDFNASKKKESPMKPQEGSQKRMQSPLPKDVKIRLITTPKIQDYPIPKKPVVLLEPGTITSIPMSKIRLSVPATARNPLSLEMAEQKQEQEARSQSLKRPSIKRKSIQLVKNTPHQLVKP